MQIKRSAEIRKSLQIKLKKFIQKSHNIEKVKDFKKETLEEIKTFTPDEHSKCLKNPTIKDHAVNVHEGKIANNLPNTKLHQIIKNLLLYFLYFKEGFKI